MNKKITAVTLTALMVLTMFTAMVPAASAAKEVAAPYEFICAVNTTQDGAGLSWLNASSKNNPSILYYDLDDNEGKENITMPIFDNLTVPKGELIYSTLPWTDDEGYEYIAWSGAKFAVVDTGNDWIISEKLVDEDDDDDHLLRVGESLSLTGGWAITALEIDVDGKKSWLSLTNDGEEVEDVVVTEGNDFTYEEDLGASDDSEVMNFTVETVFAGMNTNLVKINNIDLISTDTVEVESGDEDLFNDFEVDADGTKIEIINKDDDITFSEDDVTDIMDFAVRVNEDGNLVALARIITEPGTYELIGAVNGTQDGAGLSWLNASSRNNPSILYYDLDDNEGKENLTMPIFDNLTVPKGELIYSTLPWTDDEGNEYIAWAGAKFAVVDKGNDWIISAKLVDEDDDDDHLLRVGESLSLTGGWAITALEIDVDGKKSWLSLTNDGEEVEDVVVTEGNDFTYEEDLGASDDTEVMNFTVETVFAGMNTNLVKINNIDLISTDTVEVESADEDLYNDFEVDADGTRIEIINKDDDITFSEDDITDIMDFAVRVNEDGNLVALAQEVIVGGGAVATEAPTVVGTEVATEEPTNVTGVEPGAPTEGPTDAVETEVPTEVPTEDKVPGFEAVFAIAGLLAVAYLVLRQRE
ncbi:MAG: PGF-CTERM sorting domain-containing protein [ANME-2 cluster archaeon]|nr:PGF-CTERM sorting domain-containing protein [ANME-2 cluster archaeon]